MHICAVITSGGGGNRFSSKIKKQFHLLDDKPILYHSLIPFEKCGIVDDIIIVVPEGDEETAKEKIVDRYSFNKVRKIIKGGAQRQNSVYNGLKAIESKTDYVIIHDGVRPFIKTTEVESIVKEVQEYKAVSFAIPAKNTIARAGSEGIISEVFQRKQIFEILTPQAFEYDLIAQAHEKALKNNFTATDDSALVKKIGKSVKILLGSYENIKITFESDLKVAQKIMESWSI